MQHGHYQQQGGYDDRDDGRDRRDEYNYSQPQPESPPTSASPFAFAPPPLSSIPGPGSSRPAMPMHHSESAVQPNQFNYYQQKPTVTHHNTCPSYAASASMGYRSFSNDSQTQKASPQQPSLSRQPSLNMMTNGPNGMNYQQGPSTFQRQVSHGYGAPSQQQSYQRQNLYPTQSYYNGQSYTQPASVEMPRSLSYPSNYTQLPYPAYDQAMSTPSSLSHQHPPSLDRHNTTSVIGESMAGMDLSRQGPSLGYSFANRLPLTERPFKCDECVQSFNRNHDLKRHKRIHLSVKPFGCEKCGKTFSRKDALRRHWLVKGCRGEDGATAAITPMFPLNTSQPPTLSPPTPTTHISPIHGDYDPPSSFSQPSAPPPLSTLPSRTASNHSSQIILTPDEMAAQQQQQLRDVISPPLEEPLVMDSMLSAEARPGSIVSDSYFEGVVGLKQDGTALIDKNLTTSSSPYNPYPNSPSTSMHQPHHPYRRPSTMTSPSRGMGVQGQGSSPTMQYTSHRAFSPPGHDRKPIFAMPFTPQQQANGAYALQQQDGMLALPMDQGIKMEKQASVGADDPTTWQRWHRPSFPFPPPPGVNYNFDSSSPADAQYA